ncbi:MAG: hypothetical protein ACOCYB_00535 [Alkalispirochaeta sp.]
MSATVNNRSLRIPNATGRSLQAVLGLIVMAGFLGLVPLTPIDAQWQWPVSADTLDVPQPAHGAGSPWWNALGRPSDVDADRFVYRFLAPGTVVYHETGRLATGGADTVPRSDDLVVVKHDDGLWSFYSGARLRLNGDSWTDDVEIRLDSRFTADGPVSFAVFDAVRNVFVNTRAILPEIDGLIDDGLPVVGFVQNGSLTLSRNLTAGEAQFVVPRQWLDPATLPRRIYVLVDGLLQAEIDFTVPGEVAPRMTDSGDLLLVQMALEPGFVVVEVESHQFDGSIERRTIPFRVPDRGVLDTP